MINTGITYLDKITGGYKPGDNVVWQISDGIPVDDFIRLFFTKRNSFNRHVIYVSFNYSPHTIYGKYRDIFENQKVVLLDAFTYGKGSGDRVFLDFYDSEKPSGASEFLLIKDPRNINEFINALTAVESDNREGCFYVFDSLTGMSELWKNEHTVLDFFTYTCPKLYDLNTLAYWIYEKDAHSKEFMAGVSHTTQIVFSMQNTTGEYFDFKILKLEGRSGNVKKAPHQFRIIDQEIQFLERRDDFLKIGEKIKDLRKKNNRTQSELATLLGLTPGAISQMENSIISPSLGTLMQIASIFGKPPEYFMEELKAETVKQVSGVFRRKILHEYSKRNITVSALGDNDCLPVKIFSVIIKENQAVEGPLMLHKGGEFLYVVSGSLYITAESAEQYLETGNSLLLSKSFIEKLHNKNPENSCEFIYILL